MMSGEGSRMGAGWRSSFLPSFLLSFPDHLFQAKHGWSQGSPDLFYSAPKCCLAMEQVKAHSLLSHIWVQVPALPLRTTSSSSK